MSSAMRLHTKSEQFDRQALRRALGRFATGVCIVTTLDRQGRRIGMTVNSFSSVSLAPPLVLFSIARASRSFSDWMAADRYAINVLTAQQAELSNRFARPDGDKWAGLAVETGHGDVPLLPGAAARFECVSERRYAGGDHVILVGRVIAFEAAAEMDPLCFYAGRYRTLAREAAVATPAAPTLFYGW